MWRWIAEQYKSGRTDWIIDLKEEYCHKRRLSVVQNCFCCEYAISKDEYDYCEHCPVVWGTEEKCRAYYCEQKEELETPYWSLYSRTHPEHQQRMGTEEAYELAMKIANLKAKEEKDVFEKIKAIPTAYNVDKVIKQVSEITDRIHNYCEEIDNNIPEYERSGYKMLPDIEKLQDVIKAGGVNE